MDQQQIYPSKVRIVPNFKLSKITANLTKENYNKLVNGSKGKIVEKKNHKKYGDIFSTYTITNAEGYDNTDPLTVFDYAVLSVCISAYVAGYKHITLAMILRGLTGKTRATHNGELNANQRSAIINSLKKLMGTIITINLSDANKKLGYNDGKEQIITSALLPAYFITSKINGQVIEDVIYFDRESPLMQIAKDRKQILTYDVELLDVPNQNNTPLVIALKNYAMNRIQEIKLHKMTPTLTIDDIFSKCRLSNVSNKAKLDARNTLDKFFKHLQDKGEIDSYEWEKKGNKVYGIKFSYTPKKNTPMNFSSSQSSTEKTDSDSNSSDPNKESNQPKNENPVAQVSLFTTTTSLKDDSENRIRTCCND